MSNLENYIEFGDVNPSPPKKNGGEFFKITRASSREVMMYVKTALDLKMEIRLEPVGGNNDYWTVYVDSQKLDDWVLTLATEDLGRAKAIMKLIKEQRKES